MASYDEVIKRWAALELGERPGRGVYLRNWKMPSGPGRIHSYGAHFVLAETLRDRNGRVRGFLLNGDRSSVTTSGKHQPAVRAGLRATGLPCVVIPFTALRAAGIDRSTVRPIHVRDDRHEEIIDKVESIDPGLIRWTSVVEPAYAGTSRYQPGTLAGRPEITATRYLRGYDYVAGQFEDYPEPVVSIYSDGSKLNYDGVHGWHIKRYRHWLGDSLFTAKVGRGWHTFVSSFDHQENPALYFLAEVPRFAKPSTVEDAILALSPRIVHAAVAQGREVKRQGDMFAIPTSLSTRDVKQRCGRPIHRMRGVFGTDHVVTEQVVGPKGVTYARGTIHHRPGGLADHKRVRLGKEWHLIVPNTVPRRAGAQVRVANR